VEELTVSDEQTLLSRFGRTVMVHHANYGIRDALKEMHRGDHSQVVVRASRRLRLLTRDGLGRLMAAAWDDDYVDLKHSSIDDALWYEEPGTMVVMTGDRTVAEAREVSAVARALPYPLVVVGDGPARASLAAELAGYDVHFTGALRGTDLAAAYASADIFLFPSTTETFGQAAHEAMASGLPVVGMRAGGVPDVVRDGDTGLLRDPDDPGAFVRAALQLAEDAALRRAMGLEGRRVALTHSWDSVFDRLMDCYTGLIAARRDTPATAVADHDILVAKTRRAPIPRL